MYLAVLGSDLIILIISELLAVSAPLVFVVCWRAAVNLWRLHSTDSCVIASPVR